MAMNGEPASVVETAPVKSSEPASTATTVSAITDPVHCPYRQATLLQQALASDKMRIAFFLGAGCPAAIHVPDGGSTKPLIPTITGLTSQVTRSLKGSNEYEGDFGRLLKRLADDGKKKPNVEEILSHIRALHEVVGNGAIDGLSKDALSRLDTEICRVTNNVVAIRLPYDDTPYHHLAAWIGAISRAHAVEIFTSNYDLLMEQALEHRRVPYFDGFVGSDRTFFDLGAIEQDKLPRRWNRLWKVHGSINWWRTSEGDVQRREHRNNNDAQMIHPSHLKYDESRRMPYLAMLDRLRAFLSRGQAVLVTCGYSFADQHLNEVMLQGLNANPTAICFGLLFGDLAKSAQAVARARKQANLSLLAIDGAVLGTIKRVWSLDEDEEHPLHGLAVQARGLKEGPTGSPEERCKFLLGDFKAFGEFLAQQLAQRGDDDGGDNAA